MPPTEAQQRARKFGCNYTQVFPQSGDKAGGCLPAMTVLNALRLVGAVHEHGPADVADLLHAMDRQNLYAVTVTLAAMVPDDYSPAELLAWNDARYGDAEPARAIADQQQPLFPAVLVTRQLRPHGTHAAFVRHRAAGEQPCDPCVHGEREYQRARPPRVRKDPRRVADVNTRENVIATGATGLHDDLEETG